jgi:hypothetical protein
LRLDSRAGVNSGGFRLSSSLKAGVRTGAAAAFRSDPDPLADSGACAPAQITQENNNTVRKQALI